MQKDDDGREEGVPHPQPRGLRAVPGPPLSPNGLRTNGRQESHHARAKTAHASRMRGKRSPCPTQTRQHRQPTRKGDTTGRGTMAAPEGAGYAYTGRILSIHLLCHISSKKTANQTAVKTPRRRGAPPAHGGRMAEVIGRASVLIHQNATT